MPFDPSALVSALQGKFGKDKKPQIHDPSQILAQQLGPGIYYQDGTRVERFYNPDGSVKTPEQMAAMGGVNRGATSAQRDQILYKRGITEKSEKYIDEFGRIKVRKVPIIPTEQTLASMGGGGGGGGLGSLSGDISGLIQSAQNAINNQLQVSKSDANQLFDSRLASALDDLAGRGLANSTVRGGLQVDAASGLSRELARLDANASSSLSDVFFRGGELGLRAQELAQQRRMQALQLLQGLI